MTADTPVCPRCYGKGYTSAPYIVGVVSVMTACDCEMGRQLMREAGQLKQKDARHDR